MGPQEHALRSGVDVIVATPGRLLDHFRAPYAKLPALEYLVLDEADRMLDMGFLPDVRRILKQLPAKRQTLFFSATMPPPITELTRELLRDPVKIQIERQSAPPLGITQAVYPVQQELKSSLLVALLTRGDIRDALVFTRRSTARTAWRSISSRLASGRTDPGNRSRRNAPRPSRVQGGRYQFSSRPTSQLAASISRPGTRVNFDVPAHPTLHHRWANGPAESWDAFTFVAPQEEGTAQHRAGLGMRLPRVMVPDFDYSARAHRSSRFRSRIVSRRCARRSEAREGRGVLTGGPPAPAVAGFKVVVRWTRWQRSPQRRPSRWGGGSREVMARRQPASAPARRH